MSLKYPHIFQPLTVGGVTFKNRVFSAPATVHMIQDSGVSRPDVPQIQHYAEKARGGLACVQCGGQQVFSGGNSPIRTELDISQPANWRNFIRMTDSIHYYDAKCSYEIVHFGSEGEYPGAAAGEKIYGCSDFTRRDGVRFYEMPYEEMERIAQRYADLAECVKFCGFDTLFVHGGHGTLLQEFISPRSNHRTDEFGGSMERKARFPLMVLDAIRSRVGSSLLIEYRISGSECVSGGLELEDCIAFVRLIQDKIDLIHISAGVAREPRLRAVTHPTGFLPPACNAYLARGVKTCPDIHVPVITVGAFQQPEEIEGALARGDADLVAMARGTIADPDTVHKILDGREEEIRPCIKCFHCLDQFKTSHFFSCSVNPSIGREAYAHILRPRTETSQRVGIVGGGPAGLRAALESAQRGHSVTLYEKTDRLGGQLKDAAFMSFKYDLKRYEDYLIRQVSAHPNIEVRLGQEAVPEQVDGETYDAVLCALGAAPIQLRVPGAERTIWAGDSFWVPEERLGKRLVIVGGGQVGCETAVHYGMKGKEVTLLELRPALAQDAMLTYREELLGQLEEHCSGGAVCGGTCTAITEEGVVYTDGNGAEHLLPADTVLTAVGMRAKSGEANAFRGTAKVVRLIGDCFRVSNVEGATRTACDAVLSL